MTYYDISDETEECAADDAGDCWHDDYEVSWEGRAHCSRCNESWWLTGDEHTAYLKAEAEWQEDYYEEMRRENSWFRAVWGWIVYAFGPRRKLADTPINDEIPF